MKAVTSKLYIDVVQISFYKINSDLYYYSYNFFSRLEPAASLTTPRLPLSLLTCQSDPEIKLPDLTKFSMGLLMILYYFFSNIAVILVVCINIWLLGLLDD